jgi:transposase
MNTKLHAAADADCRPIRFLMTAGQVSDYTGAAALLGSLPAAEWMVADRGYDADWFRDALKDKGIQPLHPRSKITRQSYPVRQAALSAQQSDRDHVRAPERLAQGRNPLRQMRQGLAVRRRSRRYRHVLALKINEMP